MPQIAGACNHLAPSDPVQCGSAYVNVPTGTDTVRLYVYQNSGGNRTIGGTNPISADTYMIVKKVGEYVT